MNLDTKELRRLAEECQETNVTVELKPAFGATVIALLDDLEAKERHIKVQDSRIRMRDNELMGWDDERSKLLAVLKAADRICDSLGLEDWDLIKVYRAARRCHD